MTDQEIRVLLSTKVLNLQDKAAEFVIRKILFSEKNKIDWQNAYKVALKFMPELVKETEYVFKLVNEK